MLLVSMKGSVDRRTPDRSPFPGTPAAAAEPPELTQLRDQGNKLYGSGKYVEAARTYESGYEIAKNRGQFKSAVRFLNNLGGARYQIFQYRDAVKAYLEARDLAAMVGDRQAFAALCSNLSSLYRDMGDIDAAAQSAQQGLAALGGTSTDFRSNLLMQSGQVKLQQKDAAAAGELREALRLAMQNEDPATESQAWSELGNALLEEGNPRGAEPLLLQAYRLRRLHDDKRIYYSYETLGELHMAQSDPSAASALFSRAIEAARRISPAALWTGYFKRGQAKLAQGRLEESFEDFGAALTWLRRWRAEVLPADAFRVSSEVELHDIFSAYIDLGSRLYRETGRGHIAEQVFAVAEESRTTSLRTLRSVSDSSATNLPTEYWETLSRLHGAEATLLANESADTDAVRQLRLRLTEMETRAGVELPPDESDSAWGSGQILSRTRQVLGPDAAYLGFTLGKSGSWLWIVTREGIELQGLPPAAQISATVREFTHSVAEGSPEATSAGRSLYTVLFGSASERLFSKHVWIMALDGPLFEVPFAALVKGDRAGGGGPIYLIEEHALEVTPGVWSLLRAPASGALGPYVGLGDPVYNRADPRFRSAANRASLTNDTELSRLAGSDREIEECARIWRSYASEVILLKGTAASRENIVAALRQRPSVLHLAAHIVFPAQDAGSGMIALAMRPQGGVDFLSATDISRMRLGLGLVVLNGCSSAQATVLPGAGLMGMTRAWLAAGARAVIATRWPTPDDDTELFSSFYEDLHSLARSAESYSFARALERAQIRQLRMGGRHSGAAYWAAYFCVGRN